MIASVGAGQGDATWSDAAKALVTRLGPIDCFELLRLV
jgi:hypothetical protein